MGKTVFYVDIWAGMCQMMFLLYITYLSGKVWCCFYDVCQDVLSLWDYDVLTWSDIVSRGKTGTYKYSNA